MTITDQTAERLARLSPEKRALLELRLRLGQGGAASAWGGEQATVEPPDVVLPRPEGAPLLLTAAQRRFWLLEQEQPGTGRYHVPWAQRIVGPLDTGALRRALDFVVARHEALRTVMIARPDAADGIAAHVLVDARAPWCVLAGASPSDLPSALVDDVVRPFDLANEPPIRATLVPIAANDHVVLLTAHHAAIDAWSLGIVARELGAAYDAFTAGRTAPVFAPVVGQGDAAVWLASPGVEAEVQEAIAYWRTRLSPAPLALPADRQRPGAPSGRGGRVSVTLPPALISALRARARAGGATLASALLAGWHALLARAAAQDDVAVGVAVAGRAHPALAGVVGCFVNTVVVRAECGGNATFRDLLARVHDSALGAYAHAAAPFDRVVAALRPPRRPGRAPYFDAMFSFVDAADGGALALTGTTVTPVEIDTRTAKAELTLMLATSPDRGVTGALEYAADAFTPTTAERLATQYAALLDAAVTDPDAPLATLPRADARDRTRVLAEWTAPEPVPERVCLATQFEARAAQAPHAVAVSDERVALTYAELNTRADRLARRLRACGVGPEVIVAVCLDRSAGAVVALLAVLKAGGAYLPLDPTHPAERLQWTLGDARAQALVATAETAARIGPVAAAFVPLDQAAEDMAGAADHDARDQDARGGDALACVIYTSGSTGEPKGVLVTHRGITRLVRGADYVALGPHDVVAQASNLAFDAATFEVWGALLNGARLVVLPTDVLLAPTRLRDALTARRITTVFLTTAVLHLVAREAPDALARVGTVLFGGEAADPRTVRTVLAHGGPRRLLHVYGPTEATTFATWHEVGAVAEDAVTVPIGRPIANTRAYVLDGGMHLAPVGLPGELYLGGPGISRGYLGRPALTAERFVADPFSPEPGARLYRTGDRARWRDDGTLEFLGRLDRQVKVRGFRVEPQEIEVALLGVPGVRHAAVVPEQGESGETRLVAYVVPDPAAYDAPPPSARIRDTLARTLPAFAIPARVVVVDALPLTTNGKVDHAALRAHAPPEAVDDRVRRAVNEAAVPTTPLEAMLVRLWEELLDVRPVGIRDDFYDLGGHSLQAARMLARAAALTGHTLPVTALHGGATVERLASLLLDMAHRGADRTHPEPVLPVQQEGAHAPLFWFHGDFTGGGLYCRQLSRLIGPDQPFFAIHPLGLFGDDVPYTVEAMAVRHVAAIRAHRPHGPYRVGGFCNGGVLAFEVARRLRADGEVVEHVVVLDALARDVRAPALRRLRLRVSRPIGHAVRRSIGRAALPDAAAVRDPATRESALDALYRAALWTYIPRPYAGRVTLLVADETSGAFQQRATTAWRRVAPALVVATVPGDHLGCVSTHVDALADRIRAALAGV